MDMGCWDELCLLCGVCCGPAYLQVLSRRHVAEEAEAIAYEISSGNVELVEIIKEALLSSDDGTRRLGTRPWQPKGLARNGYADDFIAVGCFDDDNTGFAPIRDGKAPRGEHVEVRKVDSIRSGRFTDIIVTRDGKRVTKSWIHLSNCSARFPESISNIWLHSRCYRYLENWLDWENLLPPSDASFSGRPPLSFASELYEIINSRKFQRNGCSGLVPEIDYQGIEASLDQWQDYFMPCRRGTKHLARAIEAGLRGEELIPAILQDCRAWMFMRPDIWPTPSTTKRSFVSGVRPSLNGDSVLPAIATLPNELILPILRELPLHSLLTLSATCRSLHAMITEVAFFDRVLVEAISHGSLRWILPIGTTRGEKRTAYNTLRFWLSKEHRPEAAPPPPAGEDEDFDSDNDGNKNTSSPAGSPVLSILPIITSPHLDRIAFVRACWASDSMMNRRRLWGQVKQFESLWVDYRKHGWQVDRFYSLDQLVEEA